MLGKLAAVTIGDIWWYVWRGLVWATCIGTAAALLGIDPSWRLFFLLCLSMSVDAMLDPRKRS